MVFLTFALLVQHAVWAAEFCVTGSEGLQLALDLAAANNQADHIKIEEGDYASASGYTYLGAGENFDLEISGGWTTFFGNDCAQQLAASPFDTVLRIAPGSFDRVLAVFPGQSADITISSVALVGGNILLTLEEGAGLAVVGAQNYAGNVLIERTVFRNNEADTFPALYLLRGNEIVVRNSLFTDNHAASNGGTVVAISQSDAWGVYFTNNTIYENAARGLLVSTGGSSQAFIANNVIWENGFPAIDLVGNGTKYVKNNVYNGMNDTADVQSGNIIANPELANPELDRYEPLASSPAVNAGTGPRSIVPIPIPFQDRWTHGDLDLIGNLRIQDGRVDIGALESLPPLPIFGNGFESL